MQANQPAIQAATAALTLPYLETNNATVYTEFPYYAKFRALTRTLVLAGNVAWEDGKPDVAASHYVSAVTIGRRVPHNTGLLGRLVGIACETMGRYPVWKHLERMDAVTAAYTLNRLNALQAETLPFPVTLEEEKYSMARSIVEIYKIMKAAPRAKKDDTTDAEESSSPYRSYTKIVPLAVAVDTANKHMDKLIALSKKPLVRSKNEPEPPKELLTALLAPPVFRARVKFVQNETGDALLRTALALRVYRLRTGKYPAALAELVAAKLLPAVPDDPFALPGEPLRYETLASGKYLLYSIGPDSIDDNGRGIVGKSTTGKETRYVEAESQGDVVAGWYTY